VVRLNASKQPVRTEFSSSSGGYTAGGVFPAVPDLGDATAGNPHHNWSEAINAGTLAGRLGTPPITGISVTQRNGLGADGGRVLQVAVDTTGGKRLFTGSQFRSLVGLKSDWFKVNVRSYAESAAWTRALYQDLLGRPGAPSEVDSWAGVVAAGADTRKVIRSFLTSEEQLRSVIAAVYRSALHRDPEPAAYRVWVGYLRGGASYNDLNAAIYGSAESLQALGGGDPRAWVDGMYQGMLGRHSSAGDQTYWAGVAATRGRAYVTWHIAASGEGRMRRLNGYYMHLLQRPVDASGVQTWLPMLMRHGDVTVQEFLANSKEYWIRAQVRFP
jgi:hypothetical protein